MGQKQLEALFQAKQKETDDLNEHLKKHIIETKEEQEKIEELDLYIQLHEGTYADYLVNDEMEKEK